MYHMPPRRGCLFFLGEIKNHRVPKMPAKQSSRVFGCSFLFGAAPLVRPVLGADADNREKITRRWCEPRHVVAAARARWPMKHRLSPASSPGLNFYATRIEEFLLNPHRTYGNVGKIGEDCSGYEEPADTRSGTQLSRHLIVNIGQ